MKNRLLFLIAFAAILCSCDTPALLEAKQYAFFIFRFADEADKEWIITCPVSESLPNPQITNGIHNFPKRHHNKPYFADKGNFDSFDICELATEEKLLAMHDGYYTYFPYTCIVDGDMCVVRDGKWETLCDVNPLDLHERGSANGIYADIRSFDIRSLEKITHKSRTEMTIEDIEQAINKVIDEKKLDKYSIKCYNMWKSYK